MVAKPGQQSDTCAPTSVNRRMHLHNGARVYTCIAQLPARRCRNGSGGRAEGRTELRWLEGGAQLLPGLAGGPRARLGLQGVFPEARDLRLPLPQLLLVVHRALLHQLHLVLHASAALSTPPVGANT